MKNRRLTASLWALTLASNILVPTSAAVGQVAHPVEFNDSFCRAVDARPTADGKSLEIFTNNQSYIIDSYGSVSALPKSPSVVALGSSRWIDFYNSVIVENGLKSPLSLTVYDPGSLITMPGSADLTATEITHSALFGSTTSPGEKIPFVVPVAFRVKDGDLAISSFSGFIDLSQSLIVIDDTSLPGATRWFYDSAGDLFGRLDFGFDIRSPELSSPTFRFRPIGQSEWTQPFPVQMSPQFIIPIGRRGANLIAILRSQRDTAHVATIRADGSLETVLWSDDHYDVAEAVYNDRERDLFVQVSDVEGTQFINDKRVKDRRILHYSSSSNLEVSARDNPVGMDVVIKRDGRIAQVIPVSCGSLSPIPSAPNGADGQSDRDRYLAVPNPTGRGDVILTLPGGPQPKGIVAYIKGGPYTHDGVGLSDDVYWLVRQGFAVLQVNYSGSSGRGGAFERSVFADKGEKAGDDVLEALQWAQAYLNVPPERTSIVAVSYGGMLALRDILPTNIATAAWVLQYPAFDYPAGRYRVMAERPVSSIDENILSWCGASRTGAERQRLTIFVAGLDQVVDPTTANTFRTACSGQVEAEVVLLADAQHGVGMTFNAQLKAEMTRIFERF